jgi:hypothetical protein
MAGTRQLSRRRLFPAFPAWAHHRPPMLRSAELPQPWPGRLWCAVCTGHYKAALSDPALTRPRLEHAVTRSIYPPLAHLGPLDVCWSHAMPIAMTAPEPSHDGSVPA